MVFGRGIKWTSKKLSDVVEGLKKVNPKLVKIITEKITTTSEEEMRKVR